MKIKEQKKIKQTIKKRSKNYFLLDINKKISQKELKKKLKDSIVNDRICEDVFNILKYNTKLLLRQDFGIEIKELNFKLNGALNSDQTESLNQDDYFWKVLSRNFSKFKHNLIIEIFVFILKEIRKQEEIRFNFKNNQIKNIIILSYSYKSYLNWFDSDFDKQQIERFWKIFKKTLWLYCSNWN